MVRAVLIVLGLLGGSLAGCLFSADTLGLKCKKDSECQQGQFCEAGVCAEGSGGSGGTDTDTSTGSGTGSGSSSS